MILTEDIIIDDEDEFVIYVIGYKNQGESIIVTIGNKFLGVIDCFKMGEIFKTKEILEDLNIPINFICWSHSDWDHTYGLYELKEFFSEETHIFVPEGFQAKEFKEYLDKDDDKLDYHHVEYEKIISLLDETKNELYHSVNADSLLYSFNLLRRGTNEKYSFILNAISPDSKQIHDYNCNHIQRIYGGSDDWYKIINGDNNIFSVGLEIKICDGNRTIKACFTGDLTNETIQVMGEKRCQSIFLKNTFLKIPHHGSSKSDKIFSNVGQNMKFEYAACTSFRSKGLPSNEMLDKYDKCGKVYKINKRDVDDYGMVRYSIPIVDGLKDISVSINGNADIYSN